MYVVATAGHVDHGKSTLVRVLTGIDPDRLEEEKRRGLTIDLGFAPLRLPAGRAVAFVDVPGHQRFIRNMLAGVGSVDAALFVVDAAEGWMAQSEEHLRILDLVGVRRGVVALTKVGTVDDEVLELARLEVAEAVAGSGLAGAPVVAVDALRGIGLDDLRAALDRLVGSLPPPAPPGGRARLWVDRSFAVAGAGCV
ncbi:MAG: 50S ribosome-binding GTPase, partial [Acidimicrobiia bacterium]|nr:50S ribosome-binding GTPase [Acidimicrobiia bacterium]